ncbi:MAG: coenzyme F420-0:L-glutamate ligase [Armatimonadota bacterium]|nr:coenzyme F420-0:L-glutamate ligase [Armatimonadota bacterium]
MWAVRSRLLQPGEDLSGWVSEALESSGRRLRNGDVLVVAHKVVSLAEGRVVALSDVNPSEQALQLARQTGKDPRLVELVLRESVEVVRVRPGLLITRHRLGFVCANGGVDRSNAGPEQAVLLPEDPDASARRLRDALHRRFGVEVGVVVADTHGRAHREGAVGVCVGLAGVAPLADHRGRRDLYGYVLTSSVEAVADELAAAATLLMGQADEARPLVVVRGWPAVGDGQARQLVRPRERDLFS